MLSWNLTGSEDAQTHLPADYEDLWCLSIISEATWNIYGRHLNEYEYVKDVIDFETSVRFRKISQ